MLIKVHSDVYVDSRNIPKVGDGDRELLQLFKEENENLKIKIVEISKQMQVDKAKYGQIMKEN